VNDGLTLQRVLAGRREVQRVNLFTESIIIVAIALPVTVNILMFPRGSCFCWIGSRPLGGAQCASEALRFECAALVIAAI
jgi:hypothetical protein